MDRRQLLRRLLAGPGIVLAPGAYDPLTARLVEQAGFPAVGEALEAVDRGVPVQLSEQDDVGRRQALDAFPPVRGFEDFRVSQLVQRVDDDPSHGRGVVNHQYPHTASSAADRVAPSQESRTVGAARPHPWPLS